MNYNWYKLQSKWSHKNVTHIACSFLFLPFPWQIKEFLQQDGVTKAGFCHALGDLNQNSLNPFLMGKKQDQSGIIAYPPRAYHFFEKKHILEGKQKMAHCLNNEAEHLNGFSLIKEQTSKWVLSAHW